MATSKLTRDSAPQAPAGEDAGQGESPDSPEVDAVASSPRVARKADAGSAESPAPTPPSLPLTAKVKQRRKQALIGKVVDELVPGPRLKPGDESSPGDFNLKQPIEKKAPKLKLQPMLAREPQRRASQEFKVFKNRDGGDGATADRAGAEEAAPVRIRPRSLIGRFFGRARDFILFDPKLRKGPAPEDARDETLREQYRLKEPTPKTGVESVAVRPIGRRKEDEQVSGFHDVLEHYVPLHDFSEMEGFAEMSKEEQEAIIRAQGRMEQERVSSVNKRMFFSALLFAAPAVIAVAILSLHAMKKDPPNVPEVESSQNEAPGAERMFSISEVQALALEIDSAKSIEEMARFTRDPEATLPRMRRFYEHVGFKPNRIRSFPPGGSGEIDLPTAEFLWLLATGEDFENKMLAFEKTKSGLKFDWESYVNYSEVPWKEFVTEQPAELGEFRVTVALDNYFANEYSDESQWQCYRVEDPEHTAFCFAYAPRASHIAGTLDSMLRAQATEDGLDVERATVKMIMSLHFPGTSATFRQARIERVVCGGWVKP